MLTCDKHLHNVTCNLKPLASTPKSQPSYRNWKISSLDSRHDYRKFRESRIKNTQVLRINMRVTVNLLLGGYTLKKIMTSTPVAWNRVWHCSRKSCIKCTTYRLVSYLLAVTVSTLPTTMYIYLVLCTLCWFLGSLYNI